MNGKKVYPKSKAQHTFRFYSFISRWERTNIRKNIGGTLWSSAVQVDVEKAQKINGLLSVLGAYDHVNDKYMYHAIKGRQVRNSLLTF